MNFKFSEIIQSSCLNRPKFDELWTKFLDEDHVFKSVIVLSNLSTCKEFFDKFNWASEFIIDTNDEDNFDTDNTNNRLSFLIPSSYIALIKLFEINKLVNLRIMTNNVYIINRLEEELNEGKIN